MPQDQKREGWFLRATWLGLTLVISLAIGDAVLAPTPVPVQPGFIDTVLASRAAVAAVRIAIVFAALFLALSVIALVAQRRWLTRVGPVEVSEELSKLEAENQRLKEKLATADETIETLESDVANSQRLVDREQGV